MFIQGTGSWTQYRVGHQATAPNYHHYGHRSDEPYQNRMYAVYEGALEALKQAFEADYESIIFEHGRSTSRNGKTTARSQIRSLMRSKEATPYIDRNRCIQHDSVFVAFLKARPQYLSCPMPAPGAHR